MTPDFAMPARLWKRMRISHASSNRIPMDSDPYIVCFGYYIAQWMLNHSLNAHTFVLISPSRFGKRNYGIHGTIFVKCGRFHGRHGYQRVVFVFSTKTCRWRFCRHCSTLLYSYPLPTVKSTTLLINQIIIMCGQKRHQCVSVSLSPYPLPTVK